MTREQRLGELMQAYAQNLPSKRARLAQCWETCRESAPADAWKELRLLAHRLAGSAPAYGYPRIAAAAAALDAELARGILDREALEMPVCALFDAMDAEMSH